MINLFHYQERFYDFSHYILIDFKCYAKIIIFRRKSFFEKKIFNSIAVSFFFFLKLPMPRRVQIWRVGVLYKTCVGCQRGSDAGHGVFGSRFWPLDFSLFKNSLAWSYFSTTEIRVFRRETKFFSKRAFFLKNYPLSDVTETNGSLPFFFFWKKIFDFSVETKENSL